MQIWDSFQQRKRTKKWNDGLKKKKNVKNENRKQSLSTRKKRDGLARACGSHVSPVLPQNKSSYQTGYSPEVKQHNSSSLDSWIRNVHSFHVKTTAERHIYIFPSKWWKCEEEEESTLRSTQQDNPEFTCTGAAKGGPRSIHWDVKCQTRSSICRCQQGEKSCSKNITQPSYFSFVKQFQHQFIA